MGIEVLCRRAKAAGFDGMIVPDLPMEENGELLEAAKRHHLAFIPLVAPTSDERIERIVAGDPGVCLLCVVPGHDRDARYVLRRRHSFSPPRPGTKRCPDCRRFRCIQAGTR